MSLLPVENDEKYGLDQIEKKKKNADDSTDNSRLW